MAIKDEIRAIDADLTHFRQHYHIDDYAFLRKRGTRRDPAKIIMPVPITMNWKR